MFEGIFFQRKKGSRKDLGIEDSFLCAMINV